MTVFPGPVALGRGVVVGDGQVPPPPFADLPRERVGRDLLDDAAAMLATAERLRRRWAHREPTVVELAVDADALKAPETDHRAPWELSSRFAFPREQLKFAIWANAYDLRADEPVWWHGVIAQRAGAEPSVEGDVAVADTGPVWVDGGPRGPVDSVDLPLVHTDSVADGRLTVVASTAAPPQGDLAADQLAAVAHHAGPARVIAPAGSGKTRVLAARLRHLLTERGVDADQVTAVAYNARAAAELRARVGALGARVVTLHALGFEIVRAVHPGIRLVEEAEVRRQLERIAPVRPAPNTDVFAPYLEGFEQVRLGLAAPEAVAVERSDAPQFASVYARWRRWLADAGAIDFDEQIHLAVELLLADAVLRRRFQRSCRVLLVDEFQDLSPAFLLLVRLLAAPAWQVYGVGDDDQTIYSYRNADPAHLVDFEQWFPDASHYALEVNYRCPADVVAAAATLLARNTIRVPKEIRPAADAQPGGLSLHPLEVDRAAEHAVGWVSEHLSSGVDARDVAVLARVHALLLPVQVGLVVADIPVTARVGVELMARTGVRAALAWLRLAAGDPGRLSGRDIAEAVRRSPRKIRGDTLRTLAGRSTWSPKTLKRLAYDELAVWEGKELRGWLDDLELVRANARGGGTLPALEAVRAVLDEGLAELDSSTTASKQAASHLDDLTALIQVAPLQPDPAAFEPWLEQALTASTDRDGDTARVQLQTVHATKGLEWPHVCVYGANRGLMPHRLAAGTLAGREEERRVFHVAITRGRREVIVLADRAQPSPYLAEVAARRG